VPADGKDHLLDGDLLDELRSGVVPDGDELPVLLALSDNGPQMTSKSTKAFLGGARIATHFGRPATPNDQAWIESEQCLKPVGGSGKAYLPR
jgi:putative transposase